MESGSYHCDCIYLGLSSTELDKQLYELSELIDTCPENRHHVTEYDWNFVRFFEENIVPAMINHSESCIKRSLNNVITIMNKNETLMETSAYYGVFNLMFKLMEYGAEAIIRKIDGSVVTLGCYLMCKIMRNSPNSYSVIEFITNGPKTLSEYEYLKKIFSEVTPGELTRIISVLKSFINADIYVSEIMLNYGVKLDQCYDNDNLVSFLIKMIDISKTSKYATNIMCRMFDTLSKKYNFKLEGQGINYINNKTMQSLNVFEYAQKNNKKHKNILCEKIINYCIYRNICDTINNIIPMPIAEEITPHIIKVEDNNAYNNTSK